MQGGLYPFRLQIAAHLIGVEPEVRVVGARTALLRGSRFSSRPYDRRMQRSAKKKQRVARDSDAMGLPSMDASSMLLPTHRLAVARAPASSLSKVASCQSP